MARGSAFLLVLVHVVTLICNAPSLEARKLMDSVPYLEDSLILSALPKGLPPPSSPSKKGHRLAPIDRRLFTLGSTKKINNRLLRQSVPSPGVGH